MVCDQARKTTTFKMICLVEDEDERGDPTRFISTTRRNSLAQSMAAGRTLVNFSLLLEEAPPVGTLRIAVAFRSCAGVGVTVDFDPEH